MKTCEDRIKELTTELEMSKKDNTRLSIINSDLQTQINDYKKNISSLKTLI
jgi:hypothetical protein